MNQTVKRWVAVEPRPLSVLEIVSTGAVGWARMRMNQTVKRWVAVKPRPQSVLEVVSTGAVGWACHLRFCFMCYSTHRRGAGGGDGRGLGGFPKYPPAPPDPDHNDKDKSLPRTCVCVCVREICFNRRYTKGLSRFRFGNLTAELLFCLFSVDQNAGQVRSFSSSSSLISFMRTTTSLLQPLVFMAMVCWST